MHERSLLLDAIVYLAAAVVMVPIATRLRLGSVLGYLAAGCAIGPFGLGCVEDVQSIMHFSEFGVVLMLFIIGLELEPTRLWAMRRSVFGGGAAQMAVCGALLVLGGVAAGLPIRGAIVAGLALALSSTAVAIATMRERGLLNSPMGRAAFGVLLFQDIAAIPLIGIVPMLGVVEGEASGSRVLGAAKVAAAILGVVFLGRYAMRPALRFIASLHMREVFTAFSLLLVIGIAQLMELAGISMALGAFLAGVLLAGSEYRHALETDIEPFKGLLMGLFFMAVGMSIDFGLFAERPLLLAALVVGFTTLKLFGLYAVSARLGLAKGEPQLFAALLAQGGEFAFVVFGIASQARLLPGKWDEILTLVVALSMALTPLLVMAGSRTHARLSAGETRAQDSIEGADAPVIIAGFGRFGQIVGRLLFASGLRATVLDFDPMHIDFLRRFGFKIFYGDATRIDLLEAAGAAHAKLVVNAIDDVETSLRFVDIVREHFPRARIVARARNVAHYHELRARGVDVVERELFESALLAGRKSLELLGVRPYEARQRAQKFRRHNLALLDAVRAGQDEKERAQIAIASRTELERQFERDRQRLTEHNDAHWHETALAEDHGASSASAREAT